MVDWIWLWQSSREAREAEIREVSEVTDSQARRREWRMDWMEEMEWKGGGRYNRDKVRVNIGVSVLARKRGYGARRTSRARRLGGAWLRPPLASRVAGLAVAAPD